MLWVVLRAGKPFAGAALVVLSNIKMPLLTLSQHDAPTTHHESQ
jgi:hypothetical protein